MRRSSGQMSSTRIVFDTNLFVAALRSPGGSAGSLVARWRQGELVFVFSKATLREAQLVAGGRWVAQISSRTEQERLLDDMEAIGELVDAPVIDDLPPLKDAGDRRLVEAAVAGDAGYLVTADREVLMRRGYGPVEFVTTGELLQRLREHEAPTD